MCLETYCGNNVLGKLKREEHREQLEGDCKSSGNKLGG